MRRFAICLACLVSFTCMVSAQKGKRQGTNRVETVQTFVGALKIVETKRSSDPMSTDYTIEFNGKVIHRERSLENLWIEGYFNMAPMAMVLISVRHDASNATGIIYRVITLTSANMGSVKSFEVSQEIGSGFVPVVTWEQGSVTLTFAANDNDNKPAEIWRWRSDVGGGSLSKLR